MSISRYIYKREVGQRMNPQYEALAMCILPNHMLDWFNLTKVEVTSKSRTNIINLYLEENTEVPKGKLDWRSNGFTKEKVFHDFPIRGQEVLLHVKRRRWIDSEGHNQMTLNSATPSKVSEHSS